MNRIISILCYAVEQAGYTCKVSEIDEYARVYVELKNEKGRNLNFYLIRSDDDMEISLRMYGVAKIDFQRAYPYINECNRNFHQFKAIFNEESESVDIYGDFVFFGADVIDGEIASYVALMLSDLDSLCGELDMMPPKEEEEHYEEVLLRMLSMIWNTIILKRLKDDFDVPDTSYTTWLMPLQITEIRNMRTLRLKAPNAFYVPYLSRQYSSPIRETISRVLGQYLEIEFYSEE